MEDLDEYLYHIDRMLLAMRLAGVFDKAHGLLMGDFSDLHDNTIADGEGYQALPRIDHTWRPKCIRNPEHVSWSILSHKPLHESVPCPDDRAESTMNINESSRVLTGHADLRNKIELKEPMMSLLHVQ